MGMLFVLDRRTGEPLFGIEERAVPQNGVEGEVLSPTQPFSALPSLVPNAPLTADDAWGFTPWDRGKCADQITKLRSEGIYTPPSLQGTVEWPGYSGGSNWGSVSFDPAHQLVIANTNRLPFVVQLIKRDELKATYESKVYPGFRIRAPDGHALRHATRTDQVAASVCRARRRPGARSAR